MLARIINWICPGHRQDIFTVVVVYVNISALARANKTRRMCPKQHKQMRRVLVSLPAYNISHQKRRENRYDRCRSGDYLTAQLRQVAGTSSDVPASVPPICPRYMRKNHTDERLSICQRTIVFRTKGITMLYLINT